MTMTPYHIGLDANAISNKRRSQFLQKHRQALVSKQTKTLVLALKPTTQFLTIIALFWLALILLLAAPALAQSAVGTLPQNAHVDAYGSGWVCDTGYHKDNQRCLSASIPQHAYQTNRSYGQGWECLYGFKEIDHASCVAVMVPDNAYLSATGDSWMCSRGYKSVDGECQQVVLPKNAYLPDATRGADWVCERGFEVAGNACTVVRIPDNAFLNTATYGNPWTCERKFKEINGRCSPINVPENGYLVDAAYGKGWQCERGYIESGKRCDKIDLPANAHLTRLGRRWECHQNFKRVGNTCIPIT